MYLLNVEFSDACRFRVFQSHFSTVSRFPFPRFQLPQCWHERTEYWKLPAFLPNIQNVVTHFSCWECLCTLLGPISLLYKQLLQYTLLKSHCTIRFINQISKEISCETFSIRYRFHKLVHENTLALTLPCFIWVSRAIAKHARIVLTACCQCSSFTVNGVTKIKQHIAGVQYTSYMLLDFCNALYSEACTTWREDVTKTAPARRRHSVGGGGAPITYDRRLRRQQNVGGAAAVAHSSSFAVDV